MIWTHKSIYCTVFVFYGHVEGARALTLALIWNFAMSSRIVIVAIFLSDLWSNAPLHYVCVWIYVSLSSSLLVRYALDGDYPLLYLVCDGHNNCHRDCTRSILISNHLTRGLKRIYNTSCARDILHAECLCKCLYNHQPNVSTPYH